MPSKTHIWDGTQWSGFGGSVPDDPTTWQKPAIGIIGAFNNDFNEVNSYVGPVVCRRTYNRGLPVSFTSSNASPDIAAGRHSYWSWKPNLKTFPTDTSAKATFSAFLDTIPAGHKTTVIAWHEPEDNINRGDFTFSQWAALQQAAGTIVRGKGRPEIRFGICLMGPWTFDTRSPYMGFDWDSLNWGLIDVIGIDPYRTSGAASLEDMLTVNNTASGSGGSAPSMFGKLSQYNKPISLMEFGCVHTAVPAQAQWIQDAYDWFNVWNQAHPTGADSRIESALWFNYDMGDVGSGILLTGASLDTYRGIVADSKIPPTN